MFKNTIIKALKEQGYSIQYVASAIGMTRQGLYRRLNYPHIMPLNKFMQIAALVKIDHMKLIKLALKTKK